MNKVVEIEGLNGKFIIFKMDNREDFGSCSYDRTYYLIPVEDLEKMEEFTDSYHFVKYELRGTKYTIKDTDEIPFKIKSIKKYLVERAKPKTVTIYE